MATNRIIPPADKPGPQLADQAAVQEELQQRQEAKSKNTLRAGAAAQITLSVIAVLVASYGSAVAIPQPLLGV